MSMLDTKKNIENIYPLSPLQQGLLFHCLREPESEVYFEQFACIINGSFQPELFRNAWQNVMDRHGILRTLFLWRHQEQPWQIVRRQVPTPWQEMDWRAVESAEQPERLKQWLAEDRKQGFVLEQAPLMRLTLIQLEEQRYQFVWSFHHILLDGWSTATVVKEVLLWYEAAAKEQSITLPSVRPFQDYILWLQQQDKIATERYWRQYLQGFDTPIRLKLQNPLLQESSITSCFKDYRLCCSISLTEKLQNMSRSEHLTLNTLVQGAWVILLSRYCDQHDVVFGNVVSGRPTTLLDVEQMVGMFINTLPVRVQVSANVNLGKWLQQLQHQQRQHDAHIAINLADIQTFSEVTAGQPLFNTIFTFGNYPIDQSLREGHGELQLGQVKMHEPINYPLGLQAVLSKELELTLQYDAHLFDEQVIAKLMSHLQNLLLAMADGSVDRTLGQLSMLTDEEHRQLLYDFNNTAVEFPHYTCVSDLFEEQAKKNPDAIAIVIDQDRLTYQQLNKRANQLAHYLQSIGVDSEVNVGLCVERSLEMVVGQLGILKAGGTYVPLDPSYPTERLDYILSDSGIEILLTQDGLLPTLPAHNSSWMICLDADWNLMEEQSQENLGLEVGVNHLAYIIYTSGSTGQPKGVCVEHRGLLNLIFWHQTKFGITALDIATQLAGIAFDASVWEVWPYLCAGARIHLLKGDTILQPQALQDWLISNQVTITFLPTPLLESLLSLEWPSSIALRTVLTGGDKLHQQPTTMIPFSVVNNYGPTENTVVTTSGLVKATDTGNLAPSIGRPIANTRVYILDPQLQPVPVGVVGEMYIGGKGLARGYYNRPELTHERFIPNPFSTDKSSRLYRTGDLARYLADGNIEFLERVDHQVKIRGFRIELGEIEAVLSRHPQVQQAVVIASEDDSGNKRLISYIVSEEENLDTSGVREFSQQRLPAYMIPAAFVTLDTLPLTPNGKIDRKKLLLLALNDENDRELKYVAPRGPSEEIIARIFSEVLDKKTISIHDNFFDLGGHSLLATQLASRIRQSFEVEIPLNAIFDSPTVAKLDQVINELRLNGKGISLPPIERVAPEREEIPLSFAQERLWFLYQLEGASATYNIPAALCLRGDLNLDAFEHTLSEIVRRHEVLRTSFHSVNGTSVQVIHPEVSLNVERVDLQHLQKTEQETVLKQQVQKLAIKPFDLERAPLIRCCIWQLSNNEHVFAINMHHIVSDGWSIGVLVQEVSALYPAFCAGEVSPLLELEIQYADFAQWQREWLSGEVLEQQLQYWTSQLQGAPELLQLPLDRPRPSVQTYQGATASFTLGQELAQKLQALSRQTGSTLFMTLMAAFVTLLYRYSGESDVVIGSSIANRNRSEIESLIGFFVNTLVLRTRLEDNLSFDQLLKQVRETTLQAYEHQDVPFEQIVEALRPQRSMSHSPLFQVMFDLQNTPLGEVELSGVKLSEVKQESTAAKFDLTLSVTETSIGLECEWEYNTDLFDRSTIERMASHFENLLSAIVANPHQTVSELPLLSESERQQLLFDWNDTQTNYPQDKCIHQLFEEQAAKTPDAVAVGFEAQELTYRQLNERANQLAHHLQTLGVKPEVLVGICVERSLEMVVGLLGILKSGGVYVPIDSTYPNERLNYIINDAAVEILLTQKALSARLPKNHIKVCYLEETISSAPITSAPQLCLAKPHNLAYVIYTSGSTGQPKGAMIEHSGFVNHCYAMIHSLALDRTDTIAQTAPIGFDISVWQILTILLVGGKVEILKNEIMTEPLWLCQEIQKKKISILQVVPSLLKVMLEVFEQSDTPKLSYLRWLLVTGEVFPAKLLDWWFELYPYIPLMNAYGPAECSDDVTLYPIYHAES
jgi:amino acid adenylation domain-containing protein